jgi:hypothetical protein
MSRAKQFGILAGLLGSGLLVAGCQASGGRSSEATAAPPSTQAVTCDKCKVTYVQVPAVATKGAPGLVGYRSVRHHECPDCKSAAANFFATGKFQHTCKTCGDTMELCQGH